MGRYYRGDIEGKFWFGLQASDCASRFGGEANEPQYIEYKFDEDDLDGIKKEIAKIQESLGENLKKISDYFKKNNGYTMEEVQAMGITDEMLSDYADLELGIQIRDCVIAEGSCNFDADLN
jgi:hypothetical protein